MSSIRTRKLSYVPLAALLAFAGAVGGCSCDTTPGTTARTPTIKIDGDPDPSGRADVLVDFGPVALGKSATQKIVIKNDGTAPMTLSPIDPTAPFTATADVSAAIEVGQALEVSFDFAPTAAGETEQLLTIDSNGGKLDVRLVGVGVSPAFTCAPTELDFGNVVKTTSRTLTVTCHNDATLEGTLVLSRVQGDDSRYFSYAVAAADGRVLLGADQTLEIPVTFQANGSGEAFAFFGIETEQGTSIANVTLRATVIDSALQLDPDVSCPGIDFGFVAPDTSLTRILKVRNLGNEPLTVTSVELDPTSDPEFAVSPPAPHVIPADDPATEALENELELTLTFSPSDLGRRTGQLNIASTDPNSPLRQVCLTGFGGGPTISCSPASIDFGQAAVGIPVKRSYVCTNAGTDDPGTTDDNLKVTAVVATAGEYAAEVRGGIVEAGYAVGETFTVDVTYNPVDEGVDPAAVIVRNNDTAHAEHQTPITGNGRILPPCNYEVRPPELTFGIVDRSKSAELPFAIVNLADTECLVDTIALSETSDPVFSLPNAPYTQQVLGGFAEIRVPVTFAPFEYGQYDGKVLFTISNPERPTGEIPLRAASQEPCALIAPDDLDFGTVGPGCSTRDRPLQIINICDTPLTIQSVEMNAGITSEFFVRQRPAVGTTIAPGLSAEFTMSYRPDDEGVDVGSVFIQVAESPEPYMATLRGRGANDATQVDVFVQENRPKVDVLWVIDNSGSLSEEQAQISANLTAFLAFAQAQQIDFQLGVTTTGIDPSGGCPGGVDGGEAGRLFPVDGSHPRILTPATPNLEAHWQNNVNVGTCHGSELGLEAAYLALSDPLINNADAPNFPEPNDGNLGFLRRDAHLSIIFVSDEEDQSPQTTNFYYNFFLSLKGFRNANLFSAHAIVGDPATGCATAEQGDRYIDVASRAGGIFQSVCALDWSDSMETIGTAAFGFKTRFFLTNQPADSDGSGTLESPGELEVRFDGRPYPPIGPNGARRWEYVASENSIDFYPLAVPEPGTQIEVSYRVACL